MTAVKVLVMAPRLPHSRAVSGHQIVFRRITALLERGDEVGLICYASDDDATFASEARSIFCEMEIIPPPHTRTVPESCAGWLRYAGALRFRRAFSPLLQRRVGDLVEEGRYDVVLAEFLQMGLHLKRNPCLPAVRRVVSVHRSPALETQKLASLTANPVRRRLLRWSARSLRHFETELYRSVDRVIVLSSEERYHFLGMAQDLRISVAPGGVDPEYFCPQPQPRENVLLTTGYFDDPANTDALLWFIDTAWPVLRNRYPDLLFKVIGPQPPERLASWARRDPRILISGWVPDLRPYLARAKVFVCPQRVGSGVRGKLLEAMAMGLPVVATTLGAEGIPIQQGESGFIADTPEMLAEDICLLLDDAVLRERMGRNARQLVVERFSWQRAGSLLSAALSELMPEPAR